MREWLTIEVVLAVLLVTSFTCVGLLALWAATSLRHWFVRTAVVLAVLWPLLFIPTYEPYLIFIVQVLSVVTGIQIYRWWQRSRAVVEKREASGPSAKRRPSPNFSLLGALCVTGFIAAAVTIAARIPFDMWPGFQQYLLVRATSSLAILIAAWVVFGASGRRRRVLVGTFLAFAISVPLASLNDWPRSITDVLQPEDFANWPNIYVPFLAFVTRIWLLIIPFTVAAVAFELLLLRRMRDIPYEVPFGARVSYVLPTLIFALATTLILLPPLATVWKLLNPLPVPTTVLPSPNGYDDLVAAGSMFASPILNTAVEPKSTDELAAEVIKYVAAYDRARLGLAREIVTPLKLPLDTTLTNIFHDDQQFRTVARALSMECELARRKENHIKAASIAIDNIKLGQAIVHGGLLNNLIVGDAVEGIGQYDLYRAIDRLTLDDSKRLCLELHRDETNREPLDDVVRRDRAFSQNAYGWEGHLFQVLWDIPGDWTDEQVRSVAHPLNVAKTRLLMTDIAIRTYKMEHGTLPERLEQLIPDYVPSLFSDPFDVREQPFRYKPRGETYLLYSVAVDGIDDRGQPLTRNEYGGVDTSSAGDLRLDACFALDDQSTETDEDAH